MGSMKWKKKTHGAIVEVHTASATTEKWKWQILNPRPLGVEIFSKYGHAVYHWKARATFTEEP